jgi:hypothetical protein
MLWRLLVLLMVAANASAANIERADITLDGNAYQYIFVMIADGDIDTVRRLITDYENLDRINDDVVESRLIEEYDESHFKRHLRLKYCLIVFCFDLVFVEHIEHLPNGDVVARIIPEESNFHRGWSTWRLKSLSDNQTRITVEADQVLNFWIPPFIGPFVIKRLFLKKVRETVENIERIAKRGRV